MESPKSIHSNRYPAPGFVDLETVMRIESLELRARAIVDGFLAGLHRSPARGFSVEFTEYRQYVTGDDLRYLDWRLLARSDRYHIKQFEDETNLRCTLIFDNSRSMSYGSLSYSKAAYAKTLAGTLAYFLNHQRDAVGLFRISSGIDEFLPPRHRRGHLPHLLNSLQHAPAGTGTGLIPALEQIAERVSRRGLLIIISDLLTSLEDWGTRLDYLRATGNKIVVFQVLDPAELDFPFPQAALFVDVETGQEIYVDPATARGPYQERFQQHLQTAQAACEHLGIPLVRLTTQTPLEEALFDFLRSQTTVARVSTVVNGRVATQA